MSFIEMKHIRKRFGSLDVLNDVSLAVDAGEVISIIGPSGSGKSTFLRCLCQLETIDRGEITVDGRCMAQQPADGGHSVYAPAGEVRAICRRMGMVFQHFNLFPHMTVLENILEAPRVVKGMKDEEILPVAEALLRKVGLWEKKDTYPSRLSGGQKQRVAIARVFLKNPKILILDEATSALDNESEEAVQESLEELARGRTTIIIAHRLSTIKHADEIATVEHGRVVERGTHEELLARGGTYARYYRMQFEGARAHELD